MTSRFGGQNLVDPIRRVLVRRPDEAFAVEDPDRWHYTSRPNLEAAQAEHDALTEVLRSVGAEVVYHDSPQPDRADSIYVFDPVLITDEGSVVLRMGKDLRSGEEQALAKRLEDLGVPVRFTLGRDAQAEGGDLLWLDEKTLYAGLGFRTNHTGVRQLADGLESSGIRVVAVDLPYYSGPEACLHLLSLISLIDHDLAVVYPQLLPVALWQELLRREIQIVEVPEAEFHTMGTNVLALAPRECVMLEGNPVTRERLENAGCIVHTYRGNEISLKAEGGPTCLTRPFLRAP